MYRVPGTGKGAAGCLSSAEHRSEPAWQVRWLEQAGPRAWRLAVLEVGAVTHLSLRKEADILASTSVPPGRGQCDCFSLAHGKTKFW